jgi:ubiquinone/menaquinone biosynthesis C-methylase UbiE
MNKDFLPPKEALRKMLGQDFFLWEYYGEGPLGKIQAWIFRSRMRVVIEFLTRAKLYPRRILDVGCGPMFISYALLNNVGEYVGIDIMPGISLKKYSDAMNNIGVRSLHIVRASAEHLPFRNGSFDHALSLDVLEHLTRPRQAIMEIFRVLKNNGLAVISLPLENLTQKLLRIGFIIMKITGDPILKKARQVPIT